MTLTYNPNLAKVKVNVHTKYQGRRSNGSAVRAQTGGHPNGRTDRRTDGRYQLHYLPRFAVDKHVSYPRLTTTSLKRLVIRIVQEYLPLNTLGTCDGHMNMRTANDIAIKESARYLFVKKTKTLYKCLI